MDISRDNLQTLADIALRVLARGLCAVSIFDKRVAADLKGLGDGFSFAVCAGMWENAPHIKIKIENGRFVRDGTGINGSDVIIRFKDISGAIPVVLGRKSVCSAFAQHRMLVWGSVNQAVALVRIIEITEAYLFPGFILKKAMRHVPKRQAPGFFVRIAMLFFGAKKPPSVNAPGDAAHAGPEPAVEAAPLSAEDNGKYKAQEGLEAVK